jgi:hypothetical protein
LSKSELTFFKFNFLKSFSLFRICHILLRYVFIPLLQIETPTFLKLGQAFVDGMQGFIPLSSLKSRVFLARRLAGVPGYQYEVDMSKETIQRQIFTKDELETLKEKFQNVAGFEYRQNFVLDEKIHLLEVKRHENCQKEVKETLKKLDNLDENRNVFGLYEDKERLPTDDYEMKIKEFYGVKSMSEILMTEVDEEKYDFYLNDNKYNELNFSDRMKVKVEIFQLKLYNNSFFRKIEENGLSFVLARMKKEFKN